jgi:hypothetical protein
MRNIIEHAGVWQSSRGEEIWSFVSAHEDLRQSLFAVSYGSFQGNQWQTFCGEQGEGAIGQGPGLVGKEVLNEPVRDAIGRRRQESKWEDLVGC